MMKEVWTMVHTSFLYLGRLAAQNSKKIKFENYRVLKVRKWGSHLKVRN